MLAFCPLSPDPLSSQSNLSAKLYLHLFLEVRASASIQVAGLYQKICDFHFPYLRLLSCWLRDAADFADLGFQRRWRTVRNLDLLSAPLPNPKTGPGRCLGGTWHRARKISLELKTGCNRWPSQSSRFKYSDEVLLPCSFLFRIIDWLMKSNASAEINI